MGRTFSIVVAATALTVWVAVPHARAQGGERSGRLEVPGTLEVPPGLRLEGSLDLRTADGQTRVTFRPGGRGDTPTPNQPQTGGGGADVPPGTPPPDATTAARGNAERQQADSRMWLWGSAAALSASALVGALVWYYYSRYVPRKKTEQEAEPFVRAMQAIRERRWADALPDLTQVETKLSSDQRFAARFFIGLCHFHLGDPAEAERTMADLYREQPDHVDVTYFLAYLRVARGREGEAEPVLAALENRGHVEFRDTAWLTSIVKFKRGMAAFDAGQIDDAAALFAEVTALGHLAAFVPPDLRNRHIILGTRALFDRELPVAREHFEALARVAEHLEGEPRDALQARASLGLALARWIQDEPSEAEALERALTETCLLFHREGPTELPWPQPLPGSAKGDAQALKRALEDSDRHFNLPADRKDVLRCLRDLHLLRALAVLRAWSGMDAAAAQAVVDERVTAVMSRLACARVIDERFSDVYLVAGLILFYLRPPGRDRTTGVDLLVEARKLGMRDPDAMEIISHRERIERENAGAVDKYQQVLDRYLRDDTVRGEVRVDLLSRLSTHRSLMNRYRPPDLTRVRTVPPTVKEMHERSQMLQSRIAQIATGNTELKTMGETLQQCSRQLAEQAVAVEQAEADLLALTGEALFKDA